MVYSVYYCYHLIICDCALPIMQSAFIRCAFCSQYVSLQYAPLRTGVVSIIITYHVYIKQ